MKDKSKIKSNKFYWTKLNYGLLAGYMILRSKNEIAEVGKKVKSIT